MEARPVESRWVNLGPRGGGVSGDAWPARGDKVDDEWLDRMRRCKRPNGTFGVMMGRVTVWTMTTRFPRFSIP